MDQMDITNYIVVPLLIMVARGFDVSLDTIRLIRERNPNAFYTIEDVRFVSGPGQLPFSRRQIRTHSHPG